MKRLAKIYEGKAKVVYETDEPRVIIHHFKDDATAFDGKKKGRIAGKGSANARISAALFELLERAGVKTHFSGLVSENEMATERLTMIPIEVIVRNVSAGSLAKRLGYEEGATLKQPIVELYYKRDDLGDPIVNEDHVRELGVADPAILGRMKELALSSNGVLRDFFASAGLELIDFKLEFGLSNGEVILGDEISPDTCRLWDRATREKMDKDRFRRDLGGVEAAYQEVLRRVLEAAGTAREEVGKR